LCRYGWQPVARYRPRADGTIPEEEVHLLKELGRWNKKHGEAVFGTLGVNELGNILTGLPRCRKIPLPFFYLLPARRKKHFCQRALQQNRFSRSPWNINQPFAANSRKNIRSPVPGLGLS
jgi:alpha-L-fucosidase